MICCNCHINKHSSRRASFLSRQAKNKLLEVHLKSVTHQDGNTARDILLYFFGWSVLSSSVIQGINLSGGQRQRICVARALYQNTNIVFLVSSCRRLCNDTVEGRTIKRVYIEGNFQISISILCPTFVVCSWIRLMYEEVSSLSAVLSCVYLSDSTASRLSSSRSTLKAISGIPSRTHHAV